MSNVYYYSIIDEIFNNQYLSDFHFVAGLLYFFDTGSTVAI